MCIFKFLLNCAVVNVLDWQLRRFGFKSLLSVSKFWFPDLCSICTHSQLSYDELVERGDGRVGFWPPTLICQD